MHFDFSNQVAIVTGAASGLGWAIAKQLTQYKAQLVLLDKNEEGLNTLGSETVVLDW